MHIGSRSGSGTCFVAFRGCAERRNFSHLESRGNKVSEMAHEAVSCSTVCLLSSRCATRGLLREQEGLAALALAKLGVALDPVRAAVEKKIGSGDQSVEEEIDYVPRARKVLSLA